MEFPKGRKYWNGGHGRRLITKRLSVLVSVMFDASRYLYLEASKLP